MANRLTMAKIQAIQTLHEQNWRNRKIARELGVDRETVAKYVRAASCDPKPAKAPIGSVRASERAAEPRECPTVAEPSGDERQAERGSSSSLPGVPPGNSKPAKAPIGSEGSKPAKAPIGSVGISGAGDHAQAVPEVTASSSDSATADPSESEVGCSACEPYRQVILEKLDLGLSAQRIYQDLLGDGFEHEYPSAA